MSCNLRCCCNVGCVKESSATQAASWGWKIKDQWKDQYLIRSHLCLLRLKFDEGGGQNKTQRRWKKQSEELRESAASRNYSVSLTLTTRILHYRVIWSIFTIEILISAALKWRITHHFIFYSLMPSSQTAQQQPSNRDIKSLEKHITAAEMRQRFTTPSTVHPPHDSLCPSVYNVLINDNKTETISFKYTSNNHRQILYMFMSM